MKRKRGCLITSVTLATLGVMLFMMFTSGGGFLRGLTRNTATLDSNSDDPTMRPFLMEGDRGSAIKEIEQWAIRQPRWAVVENSGVPEYSDVPVNSDVSGKSRASEASSVSETKVALKTAPSNTDALARIHLTRTSGVFRFIDDVHLTLAENDIGKITVNAKSQSRVGKGDFGQNRRNLRTLVRGLNGL